MGVWIETLMAQRLLQQKTVTPCMGVWIETKRCAHWLNRVVSHPVWVCGLKQMGIDLDCSHLSHTLYGCVD